MSQDQKTPAAILDEQKTRLSRLAERRTRLQVSQENNQRQLAEAQAEAQKLFGTSDLDQLRELFRQGEATNGQAVVDFMMALDDVETRLHDIERQISV